MLGLATILCLIGAFLPWMTATNIAGSLSRSGMDGGDGPIFLALGAGALLLTISALVGKPVLAGRGAILLAIGIAIVAGMDYSHIVERVDAADADFEGLGVATVGAGLYALFAASTLALVGGIVLLNAKAPALTPAVPPTPDTRVKCPHCAELIQPDANVCRYCGRDVLLRRSTPA